MASHVLYQEDAAPTNDGALRWTVLRTPDAVAFEYAGQDGTWLDAWPAREFGERHRPDHSRTACELVTMLSSVPGRIVSATVRRAKPLPRA